MQRLTASPSTLKQENVSLEEIRNFFMYAPAAVAIFGGPDHRYILVNPSYEALFRRKQEELLGVPVREAWPRLQGRGLFEIFDKVYHTGEPFSASEFPVSFGELLPEGYINFSVYPVKNSEGLVSNLMVHVYEVTRQVMARKQLEESEEKYRVLSESLEEQVQKRTAALAESEMILEKKNRELIEAQRIAQLGAWEWNFLTNEVTWSDQMFRIYGYGDERFPINIEKALERIAAEDRERIIQRRKGYAREAQELFKKTGQKEFINSPLEYRVMLPDGTRKTLRGAGKIILNDEGNPVRLVGTVQDITDEKRAEEQIRSINKQLNEAQEIAQMGSWEWLVPEGRLTWSENLFKIYEVDYREDLGYEQFMGLVHPDDRERVGQLINEALETKSFPEFYHRIIVPSGRTKILHARGEVVVDSRGQVIKMIGTGQDVTEQKMTADKLLETNRKLAERNEFVEKLLDSSLDLIAVFDKDLRIMAINKRAETFVKGFYPEDVNGKRITEIDPEIASSAFYQDLLAAFKGEIIIRDNVLSRQTGNYYEHNFVPLLDSGREVYAVMTISHDITDNIRHREEVRKLNESDKLKSDFIKMASHELKTPVTSIKGYVQLMMNAFQGSDGEKTLSPSLMQLSLVSIDKQITRLTRLMSELLDLSKIETGKLEMSKEVFNINQLVIETVQDLLYTNPRHNINIFHDFGCNVFGDKDRLGQVLINFLTNAIKYSPSSEKIEVHIRKVGDGFVAVSVKDEGIGIDKKYHDKIFNRFYRVQEKEEQTFPGFGIGLFIAREIIEQHQGLIYFTSEKGKGSVFSFQLAIHGER